MWEFRENTGWEGKECQKSDALNIKLYKENTDISEELVQLKKKNKIQNSSANTTEHYYMEYIRIDKEHKKAEAELNQT